MPDDDPYATVNRGGLKLKGAKPTGVEKKKKKKKQPTAHSSSSKTLTKVLSDEDGKVKDDAEEELDEEKLKDLEDRGSDGKTAAERAAEEMRRKRVCLPYISFSPHPPTTPST
jgi:protein FAM32A